MQINDKVLGRGEKIIFALRELYAARGYRPYRMSKFEEYDLYARNKEFLVSDNVITFTDTFGRLMALKPDVTLSIIKNARDLPGQAQKVFYNENVYRVSKGTGAFREIMQSGVECFGAVGEDDVAEALALAGDCLGLLDAGGALCVSNLDILAEMIGAITDFGETRAALYQAVGEKNAEAIAALCPGNEKAEALCKLLSLHGPIAEVMEPLDALLTDAKAASWPGFRETLGRLSGTAAGRMALIDFSVTGDINYYNGIVFKGFVHGVPNAVLSGGQYDHLMRKMGKAGRAIGFAVYTDELERMDEGEAAQDDFINVALPKGRLGEKVYALFAKAGCECEGVLDPKRKLVFENPEKGVRYYWVKPSDVAIYVERGAADIGVAGKDILLEYEPDIYELLDLRTGKCRMAVAAPKEFSDDLKGTLRVATKFAGIARRFYQARGRDIDIIHLNGSIELAPILGLSDVIVDIVETGATLRENNLEVKEEIVPISARLIANKAAFKFKSARIEQITGGLRAAMEAKA